MWKMFVVAKHSYVIYTDRYFSATLKFPLFSTPAL